MNDWLYIHPMRQNPKVEDGTDLYDRKTISALQRIGLRVEPVEAKRIRRFGLPLWGRQVLTEDRLRVLRAAKAGSHVVLSHEALFCLCDEVRADLLIVHNYFAAFSFPGQTLLQSYYRIGARSYYGRAFASARSIVFLSAYDYRCALADFPEIALKSRVVPPPPHATPILTRRSNLIHLSGTDEWLPKRLSRLVEEDYAVIAAAGFETGDFGAHAAPSFGLINERFVVGFKLKLMQMFYCRDVIATMCDLSDDQLAVAPGHPFFRQVKSLPEALDYYNSVRRDHTLQDIDERFDAVYPSWHLDTWDQMASQIRDMVCKL